MSGVIQRPSSQDPYESKTQSFEQDTSKLLMGPDDRTIHYQIEVIPANQQIYYPLLRRVKDSV